MSAVLLFAGNASATVILCDDTSSPGIANGGKEADSSITTAGTNAGATVSNSNCGPFLGNEGNLTASLGGYGFSDWSLLGKDEEPLLQVPGLNLTMTGVGTTSGEFSFDDVGYDSYLILLKFDGVYSTFLSDSNATEWLWNTDVDGDGGFDISHLTVFGRTPSNVPEPAIIGLLSIGLLGMIVTRRRMKV